MEPPRVNVTRTVGGWKGKEEEEKEGREGGTLYHHQIGT